MKHMKQQQKPSRNIDKDIDIDWRGLAGACIFIPLLYLFGPLILIVGLLLQRWAAASTWKAPDRWASIRTFAWLCPLLYIPIWLFRVPIALFWSAHLPGQFLLWPPTFDGLFARWILALPFAPALTFLLEQQRPLTLTMRYMVRRPRPGEVIASPKSTASTSRKKASGASATKALSASGTTRKKTERDPRPVGVVWAEQAAEEQRKREAEQRERPAPTSAPDPTVQPSPAGGANVAEPEEEETTMPDPFKAKKIFDWSKVKE
jgi:hypothetical protein